MTIGNQYVIFVLVIVVEKRLGKIIVGSAGGNAGKNSKSYKISLPSKWVNKLSLASEKIELSFDGEKIILSHHLSFETFLNQKKEKGHKLILLKYYDNDTLCTSICADFTDKTISAKNEAYDIVKTAFGKNEIPTWEDFEDFLEERCVPENRSGIREYLETIGVDEYAPVEIIKKTAGRMAEDNQWLEMEEI